MATRWTQDEATLEAERLDPEHVKRPGRPPIRDTTFAEDACLARTRFAPVNNATCTNIALAIILHRTRFDSIAAATRHFAFRHQDAFDALLQP